MITVADIALTSQVQHHHPVGKQEAGKETSDASLDKLIPSPAEDTGSQSIIPLPTGNAVDLFA